MVKETEDNMDSLSSLTVHMHDIEGVTKDKEDSRDKAIDDSWSIKTDTLESVEKELDNDDL
jgi:hypothetical protein